MYEIKVIVNPATAEIDVDWGDLDPVTAVGALEIAKALVIDECGGDE